MADKRKARHGPASLAELDVRPWPLASLAGDGAEVMSSMSSWTAFALPFIGRRRPTLDRLPSPPPAADAFEPVRLWDSDGLAA